MKHRPSNPTWLGGAVSALLVFSLLVPLAGKILFFICLSYYFFGLFLISLQGKKTREDDYVKHVKG